MATETTYGVIGGAAQGAAAGASFGVPGAVIGGIIGGVGGLLGGRSAAKSRRYLNAAAAFEAKSKVQAAALARRDMLRQARMQQAQAIAFAASEEGGLQSSASQGALASGQSQLGFNLAYLSGQFNLQRGITTNLQKAGKYQAQAQDIFGGISAVAGAVQTIAPTIPQRPPGIVVQPAITPTAGIGIGRVGTGPE